MKQKLLNSIKLRVAMLVAVMCAVMNGSAWADGPDLGSMIWSTPIVNENFNSLSTKSGVGNTKSATTLSSQTNFGIFDYIYCGKAANTWSIESNATFGSNVYKLTNVDTKYLITSITGKTFGGTGAFSVKIGKTDKCQFGIYADNENNLLTKTKASVYLQNNNGALKIHDGSSWVEIGSYTGDILEVLVIYNNTNSDETYGDDVSLAAKKAHVYVNGSCVMNGASPKAFTIQGATLSTFRFSPIAANGNTCTIDDVKIYDELPTVSDYTVSSAVNDADMGSAEVDGVTITASPNDDYRVKSGSAGYTVSSGTATVTNNGDNTFTVTPSTDCTITINFEAIPTHTVTVGSHDGGSVTIENAGTPVASGSSVREGTELTITAEANDGKKFSSWSLTGATPASTTASSTTFTVGENNVTIDATFSQLYAITVNSASNGSMVADPTSAVEGATVTLTATPDAGYELSSLTVTNNSTSAAIATSGTGNSRTFTMPAAAVTVAPTFGLQKGSVGNPYTVAEVTTFITGGGSGNKYTRGIVSQAGTSISSGKMTYYISDDGTTTNQLMIYGGKNLGNTDFEATSDLKVGDRVVIYGPVTYYLSTTPEYTTGNYVYTISRDFTLTLDDMTNGSAAVQVNGVAQVPNGDGEVTVASGATVTLTATPDDGYAFAKWSSTNDSENNSTDNPLEFTMPFDDVIVGATFADAAVEYDIVVDDAVVGGSIEADVATAKAGDTVTLTATPSSGYVFDSWDVQDESSNTVTVTSDKFTMPASDVTVTATFLPVYTVNYYIGGVKNSTTRVSGEELNLDAPSTGFAGWSTANSAASPVFMANDAAVTSNLDVYAIFITSYSADYRLVEADQADWRGDYLIAYSSTIFADGRKGGTDTDCIGKQNVSVNPGTKLSGKVVDLTWGDTYNVTLEAINNSKLSDGYVLKTKDGKYNYQTSNSNGLASTATKATAANYPITVTFSSSSDVRFALGGSAAGAVFRYNDNGYFRYYKDCGQSAVYLYKRTLNATYSLDMYEAITVGSAGYTTYVTPNKVEFPSGVKGYIATATHTSTITLTEVATVPAEEPIVVEAEAGTYYLPVVTTVADDVSDNLLLASDGSVKGGAGIYALGVGKTGDNKDKVGFYLVDSSVTIPAGKAYLDLSGSPVKEFLTFDFDSVTAIESVQGSEFTVQDSAIYNLAGQRLSRLQKGVNIVNGKKVLVK